MKLFDKAEVSFRYATVIMHRHKRIKIFNDKGKDEADDDFISVRYILNHKKIIFFRNDYQDLRGFYKQLYEMLNEQIILKKA
ncbi:MAG: hypothetical protein JWP78_1872 [Mucilaginibacter sp.]|nr:hypothetical protein [Mucilaginibacter sp.]